MAVLTYSEIEALFLDDLLANVSTDVPITVGVTNEAGRAINDAYSQIWELSGGRIRKAPSANVWNGAQLATGTVQGNATDVGEVLHVYATQTAPLSLTTVTNTTTLLTSAALFGASGVTVTGGMYITNADGIPANTYVDYKTDASNLVMTRAATTSASASRIFSPTAGAIELEPCSLARIQWLRSSSGVGTYSAPRLYHIHFQASPGSTIVNLPILEYWPGTTGYYFPVHYKPQFVPLDGTITTPDVNDLESRDIAHLAAFNLVQAAGRPDLAEGIAAKLSEGTRLGLERKARAGTDAVSTR